MFDRLEKSKIFVKELNMEVVPYSVAVELLTEAVGDNSKKIEKAFEDLKQSFKGLNNIVDDLNTLDTND